jgi:putative metalloprotease
MHRALTISATVFSVLLLSACLTTEGGSGDAQTGSSAAADVVRAATISDAELQTASKEMMVQMDAQNPVASKTDKYGRRLTDLTRNLANEDGLSLNFDVYLVNDVNAFATPDGSIRVFAGLMDMMSDDELRFILGHEIGHVKLGHSLKRARASYLTSAAAKVAAQRLNAQQLADLGSKFVNAQYSQNNEFEADAYGVEFMKRRNFNPAAAESAMRKMTEMSDQGGGKVSSSINNFFSSHPDSRKRAEKIRELVSK